MLLEADLRKRKVRQQVKIDLYAAEPGPMGVAGPDVSAAVRGMVEPGHLLHPEHQIASVDPQNKRLHFANGTEAEFDLALCRPIAPPGRAGSRSYQRGRMDSVDRSTLQTRVEGVFAIGDITTIPLKMGKPPQGGRFRPWPAEVVANNLAYVITGKATPFTGHGDCFVETGDGRAALGPNFYGDQRPKSA